MIGCWEGLFWGSEYLGLWGGIFGGLYDIGIFVFLGDVDGCNDCLVFCLFIVVIWFGI